MDDFLKKVILYTTIISLLTIGIINIIVIIPNNWVAHDNEWIGFFGGFLGTIIAGVIGGFITYKGVKKTIDENRIEGAERMRQQKMPIFIYTFPHKDISNWHDIPEGTKVVDRNVEIVMKNVGEGHASGVQIYVEKDGYYNKKTSYSFKASGENGIVVKNEEYRYIFPIQFHLNGKTEMQCEERILHIYYKDCFNNIYCQDIVFTIGIGISRGDEDEKIVKQHVYASCLPIEEAKTKKCYPYEE